MKRVALTISSCVLALGLVACDKAADKPVQAKTDDNEEAAKLADTAKQAEAEKPAAVAEEKQPAVVDDTKGMGGVIHAVAGDEQPTAEPAAPTPATPEAAASEAAAAEAAAPAKVDDPVAKDAAPPADAPHYDTSKDKGSMIGHLASSLVHDDDLAAAKDAMVSLASFVVGDTTPSDAEICAHVWNTVFVVAFGELADAQMQLEFMQTCELEIEKERIKLGPEVFGEAASCIMAADSMETIELCDQAEQKAEEELHEKPHGDGVDKKTCEAAVDHMFALLRKDFGDDEEMQKVLDTDLENLRADAVLMCMDEATKAEIDCLMKAQTLTAVEVCE
jgi:hypothetical protein